MSAVLCLSVYAAGQSRIQSQIFTTRSTFTASLDGDQHKGTQGGNVSIGDRIIAKRIQDDIETEDDGRGRLEVQSRKDRTFTLPHLFFYLI